jgi:hypothetical protein
VSPLKPVSEDLCDDEIRERDLVVLVGKFMIVASPQQTGQGEDFTMPCSMTNWLEVTDTQQEQSTRRRGANARIEENLPITWFI